MQQAIRRHDVTDGPVVRAQQLVKRYSGATVVNGVDLEIAPGECFGLLGPNGAGKTTTLRMLMGLTPPTSGRIQVLGLPVPDRSREMRQRVGVVPQQDNLDPDFTVRENLATYGSYFGLRGSDIQGRILELLEFAQLRDKSGARIQTLSGGMKRRLTLARALVNNPELVVLDEPTTGLDPQARQHIWQRLRRLLGEGRTLILTTHYMEEAERLCDRLAIIDHGRMVACDTPRALIADHIEPHVLELRGEAAHHWLERELDTTGMRMERVGETVFLYGGNRDRLLALVDGMGEHHYIYRPADLEDVFLRLTGRDLRD